MVHIRSLLILVFITDSLLSFKELAVHYAKFAHKHNLEGYNIATELVYMSTNPNYLPWWQNSIANIRREFSGPLAYGSIFTYENPKVTFWSLLDWIGIDAYYPLASPSNPHPPVAEMQATYAKTLAEVRHWKEANFPTKELYFTEMGFTSSQSTLVAPSYTPKNCTVPGSATNFTAQDLGFQVAFDGIRENSDWISGVFVFWFDNVGTSDYYLDRHKEGSKWTCFFTPRGKPAFNTIQKAFSLPTS